MPECKERWTGHLALDEGRGVLEAGKLSVPLSDIQDAALCRGAVRFGKKDADKGEETPLLCLRLNTPAAQPGTLLGSALKSRSLVLRPEDERAAAALLSRLPQQAAPSWDDKTLPLETCLAEAKRGCCDYLRAGSVGSAPYGKHGLVAPVVDPELHLARGSVVLRYLGTNSSYHESSWFKAHPAEEFFFSAADERVFTLILRQGACRTEAVFRRRALERDENGSGIWFVSFEAAHPDVCTAARWLNTLRAAAEGTLPSPAPDETAAEEPAPPSAQPYDKAMLLAALELLRAAGVLTETEHAEKRALVEKR